MQPIYKVEIEGNDITDKIKPHFISLTIEDKEGDEADSFQLVLSDQMENLPLPPKGKELYAWIGYKGSKTAKYGPYIIDYSKQSGPPDTITMMAHGTDLREKMKAKKTRHFDDKTLGELVAIIASGYGLTPDVHGDFSDIVIPYMPQDNISDLVLLKKLGMQYGARVKPENGALTFVPKGIAITATKEMVEINKTDCTRYSVHLPDRFLYGSVKARWFDVNQANMLEVTVGDYDPVQVLPDVYDSESDAYRAAKAELRLIKKIQGKFFVTTPMVPGARNESPVTLKGFKKTINDTPWVTTKVKHIITAKGATSTIEGEIRPLEE